MRPHDIRVSAETEKGFDTDRTFMLMKIAGDRLYFQTFSRTGKTVDSGILAAGAKKTAAVMRRTVADRPLALGLHW